MANRLRIAAADYADIAPIAAAMRPEDRAEVLASHGHAPDEALTRAWLASRWAYTVHAAEGPLGMFGVADGDVASPWFLAAERLMPVYGLEFARRSRDVARQMQESFTSLENWVDARNLVSIRWLRWLGFTIHPATPYGVARLPFHRFTWSRS